MLKGGVIEIREGFGSMNEFASWIEAEVEVVSVIVVGDTGDPEELTEPVNHVSKHRPLELRK